MGPLRVAQRTGADRRLGRSGLAARLAPELAAALRVAPPAGQRRTARGPGCPSASRPAARAAPSSAC